MEKKTQTKLLINLKPDEWLRLYVDAELKTFSKKFGGTFDEAEVDSVCKMVADRKLQEGVDLFVAMCRITNTDYTRDLSYELDLDMACAKMQGLKLGQDVLVYLYSRWCEGEGYHEKIAHIFKQSMNYTIPF